MQIDTHALQPIPPGRYTVTVVDDTTVEIAEGQFAGRRLKVPSWNPIPKELRRTEVNVGLEEAGPDMVRNKVEYDS